jgi:hypothetical protein
MTGIIILCKNLKPNPYIFCKPPQRMSVPLYLTEKFKIIDIDLADLGKIPQTNRVTQ